MAKPRTRSPIPYAQVLALASEADVAPATMVKALRDEPIRGRAGDRARAVLASYVAEARAVVASQTTQGEEPKR